MLVTKLNDTPLTSLRQMVQLVEANSAPYLSFHLQPHYERVVLDAKNVVAVTAELLRSHGIAEDRSSDLRPAEPQAEASKQAKPKGAGSSSAAPGRKRGR